MAEAHEGVGATNSRWYLVLGALTRSYERLLARALLRRRLVLVAVGLLFIGSLTMLFGIGREFFPQIDTGQITLYVRASSGTNIEATEKRVAEVERFLEENIPARERLSPQPLPLPAQVRRCLPGAVSQRSRGHAA